MQGHLFYTTSNPVRKLCPCLMRITIADKRKMYHAFEVFIMFETFWLLIDFKMR